ncbi:hypothetical protein V6N00_13735 [Tersicoccus sp. MR15.9]|uniref:hypothetical protein n=1 Tax=Tersicoccus mangrovi TaxID=3121635 RepID=UPI002FE56D91
MTQQQTRVEKGVPTGGQYAATNHTEPDVALPAAPQPNISIHHTRMPLVTTLDLYTPVPNEFDATWPSSLPDPEVDIDLDGGVIETHVTVDGSVMKFWTDREETLDSTEYDADAWSGMDEETRDQALAWGREKHATIEAAANGAQQAAVNAPGVREAILANVTGKPIPVNGPKYGPKAMQRDGNDRITASLAATWDHFGDGEDKTFPAESMLTDLRHYAAARGLDFDAMVANSADLYASDLSN